MRAGVALLATVLVVAAALPASAVAAHAYPCGRINDVVGGRDFDVFRSSGLRCADARRWSRRWLRSRQAPRRYRCRNLNDPGLDVAFFCRRTGTTRSFYAERV